MLLVIGDSALLKSLVFMLRRYQYEIMTFTNGQEAVDVLPTLSRAGEKKLLLIAEMHMHGLSGRALIESVFTVCGDIPILILSSYQVTELLKGLAAQLPVSVLEKPFSMEMLVKRVGKLFSENKVTV